MEKKLAAQLLLEQLVILDSASQVLRDSFARVQIIFKKNKEELSIEEKESCEALTSRFSRLCDYLFQKVFRTLDQIELMDQGTGIDRLNRMEKRGVISSALLWREIRELRNDIVHEYLIERSDRVLALAVQHTPELLSAVDLLKKYLDEKKLR